jgi:molecular chaperone GrpE
MPSSPGNDRVGRVETEAPGDAPQANTDDLSPEDLRAELEHTRDQLTAAEDQYLRARADLVNYRNRAERELERRGRTQQDDLLRAWLEVVDSVERALVLEAGEPRLTAGLRAVLDQMNAILDRQGVRRIGAVGERFDPELHDAIAVLPSRGHAPGTIAQIARSGYSAGDRVVRPAEVAVARSPDDVG